MRIEQYICMGTIIGGLLVFGGCSATATVTGEGASASVAPGAETVQAALVKPICLAVIWSSGDPGIAHNVCLMYTHAAKRMKWFDNVTLIVWGPSAKLLSEDRTLQEKVVMMMNDGVNIQACVVCANNYGVAEDLRGLGIEVKPMGQPLSQMLKEGWKVLVF